MLSQEQGVYSTVADQCQYGLVTRSVDSGDSQPARKRTQFLTNSGEIAAELGRTCQGDHPHQSVLGNMGQGSRNSTQGRV